MQELKALATSPSKSCIDDEAALHMINECHPTPRTRNVDVQHFAIQATGIWGMHTKTRPQTHTFHLSLQEWQEGMDGWIVLLMRLLNVFDCLTMADSQCLMPSRCCVILCQVG